MELRYSVGEQTHTVQVERTNAGFVVTVDGRAYTVTAATSAERPGELALSVDGERRRAWVAADGPRRWVALAGAADRPMLVSVPQSGGRGRRAAGQADALEAQMPGVVRRVLAAPGEAVERGQVLVILEAMKMEIRVSAPRAGVVGAVNVAEGEAVERGQVLVTMATPEA
jgi:3-methylcrotonyl-CoA carboxylase alpha subunit